jgi:hypothetical protein
LQNGSEVDDKEFWVERFKFFSSSSSVQHAIEAKGAIGRGKRFGHENMAIVADNEQPNTRMELPPTTQAIAPRLLTSNKPRQPKIEAVTKKAGVTTTSPKMEPTMQSTGLNAQFQTKFFRTRKIQPKGALNHRD